MSKLLFIDFFWLLIFFICQYILIYLNHALTVKCSSFFVFNIFLVFCAGYDFSDFFLVSGIFTFVVFFDRNILLIVDLKIMPTFKMCYKLNVNKLT